MRKLLLTTAVIVMYFTIGCSSSSSTPTTIAEPEGSGDEQTGPETGSSGDNQTMDGETQPDPDVIDVTATNPLENMGELELIASDFSFLEGPVYRSDENALYFSDIAANTIFRRGPDGTIAPFRENQPTNGLVFDSQNRLLIATQSGRTLSRLDASGNTTVLADRFEGALLNSPNDIALHTNGDVYFTDPPYGIDPDISEVGCAGVYRLQSDGNLSRFWCNGIDTRPNGIAFSPNQETLYVAFTRSGEILRWSVTQDGSIGELDTFVTTAGGADGMVIDGNGNLFTTSRAGIEVFAADGTRWGEISVPEQTTNCTLGGTDGKTLFITGRTALYSVELQ